MNIGIDIDGVLIDLERFTIDYGTKMCVEENIPINLNLNEYWETKKFDWTQEQDNKFWNKFLVSYVNDSKPRVFAPQLINKLQQNGNKIYIITARNEEGLPQEYYGQMQELTKKWLEKNNIKYDKIIFTTDEEKMEKCIENNIDVMIEDSPKNIQSISSNVKVIKYDCQYNKNISGNNIITAFSWYHIFDIINKM